MSAPFKTYPNPGRTKQWLKAWKSTCDPDFTAEIASVNDPGFGIVVESANDPGFFIQIKEGDEPTSQNTGEK